PESEGFIRHLQQVVQQRHRDMPEGSYTTKLFIKGVKKIAQKVGEEAVESVVEAVDGNRDRFIYEASDMIYHLLVLMEQMGCSIEDMERELALRHK
ncbi:MAG: phosphoribosyl-ATP diphosphatase, partial [Alistipes sp.]|nr:phosphoribosyl-ATP diphosphatase [Alistipes sp.]